MQNRGCQCPRTDAHECKRVRYGFTDPPLEERAVLACGCSCHERYAGAYNDDDHTDPRMPSWAPPPQGRLVGAERGRG